MLTPSPANGDKPRSGSGPGRAAVRRERDPPLGDTCTEVSALRSLSSQQVTPPCCAQFAQPQNGQSGIPWPWEHPERLWKRGGWWSSPSRGAHPSDSGAPVPWLVEPV